jgi:Chromate transporter
VALRTHDAESSVSQRQDRPRCSLPSVREAHVRAQGANQDSAITSEPRIVTLDPVFLSRLQFGFVISFPYLFFLPVVVLAFFGPTAVLTFIVGGLWNKLEKWPWRRSIQQGLTPVSIGLLLAGCFTMAKGAILGFRDGNDCGARPIATIELQDKSGLAHPGWGGHWCIGLHAVKAASDSGATTSI